ncbi:MAG: homoserine O-acetyltransferase [Acidobacteriota bacterium]
MTADGETREPVRSDARRVRLTGPFTLESGAVLPAVDIAYRSWGRLDPGSDAVLVCHALTGSADADLWWSEVFGPGRALDPTRELIVCSNVLGSCYGSTGPTSTRADGRRWGGDFPRVTIRDMVRAQAALLDHLGVRRLRLVVGGSMGGMQALEWPLLFPDRVDAVAAIGCSARHSPWCIGLSEAQRLAIRADPKWRGGAYPADDPPAGGLAAARAMAMCTYRSWHSFEERFGRRLQDSDDDLFAVESYLRHHGEKLIERFDPATYVTLTHAMDSHDVGRGRGGVARALGSLEQPVLVVSIDSDVLYPPVEQKQLVQQLPHGELMRLESAHGHDGFLIDVDPLAAALAAFRGERAAAA